MFWIFPSACVSVIPHAASCLTTVLVWAPYPRFLSPLSPRVIGYLKGRYCEREEKKGGGGWSSSRFPQCYKSEVDCSLPLKHICSGAQYACECIVKM